MKYAGCVQNARKVLQTGATLLAMDFSGCGLSEGSTITLGLPQIPHHDLSCRVCGAVLRLLRRGYREKDDAQTVIEHLRASGAHLVGE
eukprot:6393500-Amphidinium_carterae.1